MPRAPDLAYEGCMAGAPHDVLVMVLRDRPLLLAELVERVARRSIGAPVAVLDSAVRVRRPIEVRPDLVVRTREAWAIVEVQNRIDEDKQTSWPIAVAELCHEHRRMGDLFVITASRRVAAWATRAARLAGDAGTRLDLTPVVMLIAGPQIEALLDPEHPELGVIAAWAMQKRRGPKARAVIDRAMELVGKLPPPLQDAQARAIVGVLSEPMLALLKERSMLDADKIPESPAARRFRLFFERRGKVEGKVEGMREALLAVLEARGLAITEEERARIDACTSRAELDCWIKSAATETSAQAALQAVPVKAKRKAAAKAPARTAKRASRKQAARTK